MRTLTLREVSKKINVPPSTIKQWERDLSGVLIIPRTKQGARIYSDIEINQLREIKHWEAEHLGMEEIREILQQQENDPAETENDDFEVTIPALSEEEEIRSPQEEISSWDQQQFFLAMDQYKQTFLNEVKEEIRSVLRTEVVEEVKQEISKGTFYAVDTLSDSLNKANANMEEEMKELSFAVQKTVNDAAKSVNTLEKKISEQSLETSEEFYTISKQLAETAEEISHYIDTTNNEILTLAETLEKDREYFIEDREKLRREIRQREVAFQSMLSGFRVAASAKERKWWKFW